MEAVVVENPTKTNFIFVFAFFFCLYFFILFFRLRLCAAKPPAQAGGAAARGPPHPSHLQQPARRPARELRRPHGPQHPGPRLQPTHRPALSGFQLLSKIPNSFQHETILFRQPNSIFAGSNVIPKKYGNEKKKENSLRFN